jgi:poly-gamma-glutamate capsule biosynthesis protein CapA/YwtB (metallophosphatase superfamily)
LTIFYSLGNFVFESGLNSLINIVECVARLFTLTCVNLFASRKKGCC